MKPPTTLKTGLNRWLDAKSEASTKPGAVQFLELLLSARAAAGDGLHLVGTLRADFWAQLLEHPDAGRRLAGGWFGLSPMTQDRLERVITEPARARGVHYQDGLAAMIAADAGGGRGLPLLEFALTQLWPHQRGREISLSAYQGIGGVPGALSAHAEQAYRELSARFPGAQPRRCGGRDPAGRVPGPARRGLGGRAGNGRAPVGDRQPRR
jgi:hypothetical protein